jgi:hypothetical protein
VYFIREGKGNCDFLRVLAQSESNGVDWVGTFDKMKWNATRCEMGDLYFVRLCNALIISVEM